MPSLESNIVDAYIFRRFEQHTQFFLVLRGDDMPMGGTWQSIHAKIETGEKAHEAAARQIVAVTGFKPVALYSADFVGQFYDFRTDTILLAPTFAAEIRPTQKPTIARDFTDYAWCDLEETTARLPLTNQRWAARHIYDVIVCGGAETALYRIDR